MSLTYIFCDIDDFCKELKINRLPVPGKRNRFTRETELCTSEIMTILVLFHLKGYRTFKWFYCDYVRKHYSQEFPKLVSYNRFVELIPRVLLPLFAYLSIQRLGSKSGTFIIDSTALKVCENKRIHNHKVFAGLAERGKTSVGWFYGFKLHLIINEKGEIISFYITKGNVDDRNEEVIFFLTKNLKGKLFGDRGYISQKLFKKLLERGIKMITKIRRNMKNILMDMTEKLLLRKRAVIESVNEELKNICQMQRTRHRSVINWMVNITSGLIAYSFFPKKPSIDLKTGGILVEI